MNTPYSREDDFLLDEAFLEDFPDADSLFIEDLDDTLQQKFAGTPWEARIRTMSENTPWEERIALYQDMREAQALPEEAIFFLITWAIEALADDRISHTYDTLFLRRIEKIRRDHGLSEFEEWEPGQEPADFQALLEEFNTSAEAITRSTYQRFGEYKYLDLHDNDPDTSDQMYEAGHNYIEDLIDEYLSHDDE